MATDYVSGRIYNEELDLSFFIEGLGRTITGFVGSATWGPMNSPSLLRNEDEFKDQFGVPVADSNSYMCARSYFQRGNSLSMIRVGDGNEAKSQASAAASGGTPPVFRAKYPGSRGDLLSLAITAGTLGAGYYKITLLDNGNETDVFDNIPIDITTDLQPVLARSTLVEAVNGTGVGNITVPQTVDLISGNDGISTIDAADYIGVSTGSGKTGLQILKAVGDVDADFILSPNTQSMETEVWQEMIDISENRQDLLAILDSPAGFTVNTDGGGDYGIDQFWRGTSSHAETLNVNSSFAATYWDWVTIHDYYNGVDVSIPPSAAAAGALNYSDRVAYPWWAAAGVNRANLSPLVKGTGYQPLDEEITILQSDNTMGCVNPILLIENGIYAVMGQKTMLRTNSALNRINTRRMVNKLKKALLERVSVLQYEPNDETTWRQFKELIKPFLDHLVNTRGLISYDIQVGLDISMTAADVAAGRLIGRVVLVLMPTAEKVVIGYVITDQSANFSELGTV